VLVWHYANVSLACHGARFRAVKPGIAKVRDDLAALVPRASVVAVDAATGDDAALRTADVLVGTEAVLHRAMSLAVGAGNRGRPGVVAFLELDQELLAPRARAAEQALWLLVRAARLVGSRRDGGEVVQTRLRSAKWSGMTGSPLVTDAGGAARLGHPPFRSRRALGRPGANRPATRYASSPSLPRA
jgi:primosomal protein N' (replication factor Y)